MFSRSFIKSPGQTNQGIAARAHVSRESVRRSAACSGEHNYTYSHTGFRAFQDAADGNYAQNLINDYQEVYEKGNPTLPYHAALTALHHKTASTAVTTFLAQPKTILQLVHMHDTAPAPTPALAPAPAPPAPAPEPTCFAKARNQLAKMKFELPPPHPKRTIVYRSQGCDLSEINTSFDPESFASSSRNTFVKTCCRRYNSVHECRCFKWCSKTSVDYVNEKGEGIHVDYLSRKTDYQNLTRSYPTCYQPDDKNIPHSPRVDVSDSDLFPWNKDYDFEDERADAWRAEQEGFTHVWSSKVAKRRHLRRQSRLQQLASGELPEHGLIIVTFDIDEVSPPVTKSLHAQYRLHQKQKYEELQQHARFYESWYEEHYGCPEPAPLAAASAPAPVPRFNTAGLLSFQIRRLIQQEYREQSIRDIQRPLSDATITIAHGMSRAQVTEISALKTYQRTRLTAFASLAAFLAIRFSAERGHTASVATILHHRMIQFILRRATGSVACAQQISAPYIKCESPIKSLPHERIRELRAEAECRFDTENPSGVPLQMRPLSNYPCSTRGGPIQYHTAKYYAQKCLELIGNPDDAAVADSAAAAAAARWSELDAQILRVRRGEIAAHEVFASPKYNNWIYMVNYTYIVACRQFLTAIECWRDISDTAKSYAGPGNQCPTIWRDSHICKDSPSYVQCVQIVHEMYRFIYRAARIISPQYMAVFGFNQRYVNSVVQRTRYLAHYDGDETSALMFGFLMPAMMTPDVHVDIFVEGHIFQHPTLYVKMSDPVFGPVKKQFRDMIPSRHTGTIDRTTLMNDPKVVRRA
jgi:hypothetical protein